MSEVMTTREALRSFPKCFWVTNVMEIFERMAWYGFFALSTLYISGAVSDGGLGFSSEDRGIIQGTVSFLIYLFPFITGALGDRYGYKRMLLISYLILAPGYYLLGQMDTMPTFFAAMLFVGAGASIFKPLIVGTIGRVSNKGNGSLAFGIFYMMVNIGGFAGPFLAAYLRSHGWEYVFIASAIWIAINIPILLIFYKEPPLPEGSTTRAKPFGQVMQEMFEVIGNGRFFVTFFVTLVLFVVGAKWFPIQHVALIALGWIGLNLLIDVLLPRASKWRMRVGHTRFLLFLFLLSSFWIAFNQLFITLPLYLEHHVDSTSAMGVIYSVGSMLGLDTGETGFLARMFADKNGGVKPEHIININAFCIIFFQVIVSIFNSRMKPLMAIMVGVSLTGVSFVLIAMTGSIWFIFLAVAVFSFGEMMASPKAKEYTAHAVAPSDKVGMYMGYYMWSNALGSLFGGLLSGTLYKQMVMESDNAQGMWLFFAGLSFFCCVLIYIYHVKVGRKIAAEKAV
ncbi:MAG: MFS transporter [Proteobacteria bacterium]|nr:MFS transporter [Pseudomonadota bacterium]